MGESQSLASSEDLLTAIAAARKTALSVLVLATLFTGFFWLGYWTADSRHEPVRAPDSQLSPAGSSPIGDSPARPPAPPPEETVRL